MKRLLCIAACACVLLPAAARAQAYAEVFGGAVFPPDLDWDGADYDLDTGLNIGASFGVFVGPQLSLEAEALYTQAAYACCSSDLESVSLMGNAVYHLRGVEQFQPYVGVGTGGVRVVYDGVSYKRHDTVWGWQAMLGGEIPFSETASLVVEYRYQDAQQAENEGLTWQYRSHDLSAGVRIWF